jgi:hypothetical protein
MLSNRICLLHILAFFPWQVNNHAIYHAKFAHRGTPYFHSLFFQTEFIVYSTINMRFPLMKPPCTGVGLVRRKPQVLPCLPSFRPSVLRSHRPWGSDFAIRLQLRARTAKLKHGTTTDHGRRMAICDLIEGQRKANGVWKMEFVKGMHEHVKDYTQV